jgi:hypothetical protein
VGGGGGGVKIKKIKISRPDKVLMFGKKKFYKTRNVNN